MTSTTITLRKNMGMTQNCCLLTHADSLMYEIITNDIYKELFDMIKIYLIIVQ